MFFATAAKGTEPALRDELRELRIGPARADRGGVHFGSSLEHGWRACLWSRVAVRVLLPLASFEARDADELYEGVRSIDWRAHLTPRKTLAVSAVCRDSALTHSKYIALRSKDAIVDQLRDALGARPSVDVADPDVQVFVRVARDRVEVALDLAGESLHRRGYRARAGEAPLKETLAAAILRLGGWDRTRPLLDPMCGSGTIAIEADLWARGVAPGLGRARFGFERWEGHGHAEAERMRELRERAQAAARAEGPDVLGCDADAAAIELARDNARRAGSRARFEVRALERLRAPAEAMHIVTNPPYGERLEASADFYRAMAEALGRLRGSSLAVLAGNPEIARALRGLRERGQRTLFNGALECRLLTYDIP